MHQLASFIAAVVAGDFAALMEDPHLRATSARIMTVLRASSGGTE